MKKKIYAILVVSALVASLMGCGNNKMSNVLTENTTNEAVTNVTEEETKIEETGVEEAKMETIEAPEGEMSAADEPTYKESNCLYMLGGNDDIEVTVDMDAMEPDGRSYYIVKSINIYNKDASIAGYTKENVSVSVVTSNDEWSYCQFDGYNYLVKTKDLLDSIWIDEKKPTVASTTPTPVPAPTEESKAEEQPVANVPVASKPVESVPTSEPSVTEQPAVEESDKYTPEEAIAVWKAILDENGMIYDPSIKEFASWGTGFLYLDKGYPEQAAQWDLEGMAYGNGAGTSYTRYYFEVTGSDENCVYTTAWGCN